jgi:hypothetical protein
VLYKTTSRCFQLEGSEYRERGLGELHVNLTHVDADGQPVAAAPAAAAAEGTGTGAGTVRARLLLRVERTHRVACNLPLFAQSAHSIVNERFVRVSSIGVDAAAVGAGAGAVVPLTFLFKVQSPAEAATLNAAVARAIVRATKPAGAAAVPSAAASAKAADAKEAAADVKATDAKAADAKGDTATETVLPAAAMGDKPVSETGTDAKADVADSKATTDAANDDKNESAEAQEKEAAK